MTKPARSEITVTGMDWEKLSRNSPTASAKIKTTASTVSKPAIGRALPRAPKLWPALAATGTAAVSVSERSDGPGPRFFVIEPPYPDRLKLPLEP